MRQQIPREDELGTDTDANPETLCANWRLGCNGLTEGDENGYLQFCDDCTVADILLRSSAREGIVFEKRR